MAVWNPHGIPLSSVPDLLLSSGRTVPIIGLGTWQIKPAEAAELIATAIDIGYRHFDCASFYGNLEGIGNGINTKVAQGYVAREEIFITAKLPVYMNDPADVREALKTSLKQLKLNYVDMFLVHTPVSIERGVGILMGPEIFHSKPESPSEYFKDIDPSLVWKEMEKLVVDGLAKSIGLSNFNQQQIQKILDTARIKPAFLQVECHANFPQEDLSMFCRRNNLVLCAYAPLGSPARFDGKFPGATLIREPVLASIAKKHGKTPAQVLLRSLVQRQIVVIPKTVTKARLLQNFDIFDFDLSEDDAMQLQKLGKPDGRLFNFDAWNGSPHYPF